MTKRRKVSWSLGLILGLMFAVPPARTVEAQAGRGAPRAPPCGPNLSPEIKNVTKDSRCFELRTYTVQAGSSMDTLGRGCAIGRPRCSRSTG